MAYQYKGQDTYAAQLAKAQAETEARRAALDERRRQLKELKAAEKQAEKLAAEQAAVEREIERRSNAKALPEPVYGGPRGLAAAAKEAAGWWTRKQASAV